MQTQSCQRAWVINSFPDRAGNRFYGIWPNLFRNSSSLWCPGAGPICQVCYCYVLAERWSGYVSAFSHGHQHDTQVQFYMRMKRGSSEQVQKTHLYSVVGWSQLTMAQKHLLISKNSGSQLTSAQKQLLISKNSGSQLLNTTIIPKLNYVNLQLYKLYWWQR